MILDACTYFIFKIVALQQSCLLPLLRIDDFGGPTVCAVGIKCTDSGINSQ